MAADDEPLAAADGVAGALLPADCVAGAMAPDGAGEPEPLGALDPPGAALDGRDGLSDPEAPVGLAIAVC